MEIKNGLGACYLIQAVVLNCIDFINKASFKKKIKNNLKEDILVTNPRYDPWYLKSVIEWAKEDEDIIPWYAEAFNFDLDRVRKGIIKLAIKGLRKNFHEQFFKRGV